MDYYGGDLTRGRVDSLKECGNWCSQHSECKRWSYLEEDVAGRCYVNKNASIGLLADNVFSITGFRDSRLEKCGNNGKIGLQKAIYHLYNLKVCSVRLSENEFTL